MAKGIKTGGRKKGTPNKATRSIEEKLAALGCDPIEGMARIAMHPRTRPDLKIKALAEIAQYVLPKRKAVEHSGPDGSAISTKSEVVVRFVEPEGSD